MEHVSEFDWTEYGEQYDRTMHAYHQVLYERAGGSTNRVHPTLVEASMKTWHAEMDKLADMQVVIAAELSILRSEVTRTYLRQLPKAKEVKR